MVSPGIYCFWHSQLLMMAYLHRGKNIHVLISNHADGEYIVRVTRRMGYGAMRGSATRGGVRALSDAIGRLSEGISIGITPDGSRGPRQEFKKGALFLARASGVPLQMGVCVPEKCWRLKS
jgi:hypothetical protein